jgi:hypothetical protein
VATLVVLTALAALTAACSDTTSSPKSNAAGAGGSPDGAAGKGSPAGANGGGADGGKSTGAAGEMEEPGGSASQAGSASGGSGNGGAGGGPVGGAGVSEHICSTDPERCFDVVHQQWRGSGNSGVLGVDFDSKGNLVVAASTLGGLARLEPSNPSDFLLNWTPSLQFVSAQQDLGISRELALDANDNALRVGVYDFESEVSGTEGLDLAVTKTAPDGTKLWRKAVASMRYDDARGMATDAEGNCYIGGFTYGQFADDPIVGKADALIVKLDPNGETLWAHQFGSTDFDSVESLCTDAAGNAYVAGSVTGTFASAWQGEKDLFIAKFSPSGERLWAKQVGSAGLDGGTGVACGSGFVYVVGVTNGRLDDPQAAAPTDTDVVLLKYDAAGTQLWLKQWLTKNEERYLKVAVGLTGNAIVAGGSATDLDGVPANGPGGETDLFLGEWSGNGEALWTYQWGSDSWDSVSDIAISPSGRIAVGAHTQAHLPQFAALGSGGAVLSVFTPK